MIAIFIMGLPVSSITKIPRVASSFPPPGRSCRSNIEFVSVEEEVGRTSEFALYPVGTQLALYRMDDGKMKFIHRVRRRIHNVSDVYVLLYMYGCGSEMRFMHRVRRTEAISQLQHR